MFVSDSNNNKNQNKVTKEKNMSHELKEHDMQEGREMAWHGLTKVNPELSLVNCNLNNWDYVPRPVLIDVEGKPQKTPFNVLGVSDVPALIIGRPYQEKTFKPILNARLLERLSTALEKYKLPLESCGTIMNRGRMFLSFGLKDAKFNAGNRDFHGFLNIQNGNDMSAPLMVNTSNICTVCNNTFTMNMESAGMIMEVKKTQFSDIKINDMGKAIEAMLKGQKEFAKTFGLLNKIKCDEETARCFFAGFVSVNPDEALSTRAENTVIELVNLFQHGKGNNGDDMSDTFSAITDYYTHVAASADEGQEARWKNFVSSEFGAGKKAKMDGWAYLTDEKLRKATVTIGKKVLKLTADKHKAENAAK